MKYKRWFRPAMVGAPGRFANWGSNSENWIRQIDSYVVIMNSKNPAVLIWDKPGELGGYDAWGILEYEEEGANEWGEVSP